MSELTPIKTMDKNDKNTYDVLIRRLKVLSKSQSAFLKVNKNIIFNNYFHFQTYSNNIYSHFYMVN